MWKSGSLDSFSSDCPVIPCALGDIGYFENLMKMGQGRRKEESSKISIL
jgi:hypothetical protein